MEKNTWISFESLLRRSFHKSDDLITLLSCIVSGTKMGMARTFTPEIAVPRRAISEDTLLLEIPHTILNPRHVSQITFCGSDWNKN